ncbi:MAG: hypothetical protein CVV47_09700 [Spirochaetae bacterium HGW-Spirochaetae-3]|nr:MAG: hypothetical protein CVV47_09700 [Spirochaetae bacterium HGW-Spirochaetae-3]
MIGVGAGVLALVIAVIVALSVYSGSEEAKTSLVVKYFRALASGDEVALDELTSSAFQSDLGLGPLGRDSYELFEFGEPVPGTIRFLIVLDDPSGTRRAIMADMAYKKHGLVQRVESIRRIEGGKSIGK